MISFRKLFSMLGFVEMRCFYLTDLFHHSLMGQVYEKIQNVWKVAVYKIIVLFPQNYI